MDAPEDNAKLGGEAITNRECVLALQGGGVYGLTMLGQAKAVIEDFGYSPRVLAGNSAGAIVASLLWAGLAPSEIEAKLVSLADTPEGLAGLFGPFDRAGNRDRTRFDLRALDHSRGEVIDTLRTFFGRAGDPPGLLTMIRAFRRGLRQRALLRPFIGRRGLFTGEALERQLDSWYRAAPGLPEWMTRKPPADLLTFGDFRRATLENPGFARPPLFLTATNLSYGRLELFSSIDPACDQVPIASAVRASAGFPVFFRPIEIPQAPGGGLFVDGGVISNYPVWIYSHVVEAFASDEQAEHEVLGLLARRPLLRIGLRVVDPGSSWQDLAQPSQFYPALGRLLAGTARRELEDRLASRVPRLVEISQPTPTTGGPKHLLDVNALRGDAVQRMVRLGREFASRVIEGKRHPQVLRPHAHIESSLAECAAVVGGLLGISNIRANVFLADADSLRLSHVHNMPKSYVGVRLPTLGTGLAGFTYWFGTPYICNLTHVDRLAKNDPSTARELFGDLSVMNTLEPLGSTWLASVPIFDPYEARLAKVDGPSSMDIDAREDLYANLTDAPSFVGPRLGVLNVEATINYQALQIDEDPASQLHDPRIRACLNTMQVASLALARELIDPLVFDR